MRTKQKDEVRTDEATGATFGHLCLRSCRKILARIREAKAALFAELRKTLKPQEHRLRLALNEAEALAWLTAYPHLVFPALATEKVQAVVEWNRHQQAIRHVEPFLALAA